MADFTRKPDETPEEYELRICAMKKLLDKKWDEIAQIINDELGQQYSESRYRKRYQYAVDHQALGSGGVIDTNALDAIEQARTELAIERQKLAAEKLELTRQIRMQSRFELFYDRIAEAVRTLPVPTFHPLNNDDYRYSERDYVLTIADLHYGASFEAENNCYSRSIASERMELLCSDMIQTIQQEKIRHINIVSLGDTISGMLRMTDIKLNEIPVVDCVVEVSRLLAQFLNTLSAYCEIDYYAVSAANHSQTRPLGSKANEIVTEDLERIIVNYVNDMLKNNERIAVHIDLDRDSLAFEVVGMSCLALHGHQVNNLQTAIKDYSALHQRFYDYLFCGHYHSAQEITVGERENHSCEVLVSGSIVGSDTYSDKLRKGSKACAQLYEFDAIWGHIGTRTFILN